MVLNAEFLAQQLAGLHFGLAILLQDPKWQISADEATMLATSAEHCAKAFDVSVDPRILATTELLGVCALIYVPRFLAGRQAPTTPTLTSVN